MLPNGLTGPRLRRPPIRSDDSFRICLFNRRNLASIGIGLAVTTLLLVIFAYHGGAGVGSWFHSLLVMVSVLAFVFFGPLFLCLCYYRQMQVRQVTEALRHMNVVESGTQTGPSDVYHHRSPRRGHNGGPPPQLYACIIIAPGAPSDMPTSEYRTSGLPNYDEAIANSSPLIRDNSGSANCTSAAESWSGGFCSASDSDTMPPPTYDEAMDRLFNIRGSSYPEENSVSSDPNSNDREIHRS